MWGIFSFLFHLLHPKIFPKICFFEDFLDQKIISKTVFLKIYVWWQHCKNNCIVSTNFLTQKTIGKGNIFSNFLFQEMSLKREIFVNFLPQKFIAKYGIVSTYSVTFVSQKILTCLQCQVVTSLELLSLKMRQKTQTERNVDWKLLSIGLVVVVLIEKTTLSHWRHRRVFS